MISRRITRASFALLSAVSALALIGCSTTGLSVATEPCLMVENRTLKTFYGVDQNWKAMGDTGTGPLVLTERKPSETPAWQGDILSLTPVQRRLNGGDYDILLVAMSIAENKNHWDIPTSKIRWIVANNPLVVAIGVEEEPVRRHMSGTVTNGQIELGGTYRVVTAADKQRVATDLAILRTWPAIWPVRKAGEPLEDTLRAQLFGEGRARRMKLDAPMTLEEIQAKMPWEKEPPPPPPPASQPATSTAPSTAPAPTKPS